jgi:hypothetical protein
MGSDGGVWTPVADAESTLASSASSHGPSTNASAPPTGPPSGPRPNASPPPACTVALDASGSARRPVESILSFVCVNIAMLLSEVTNHIRHLSLIRNFRTQTI